MPQPVAHYLASVAVAARNFAAQLDVIAAEMKAASTATAANRISDHNDKITALQFEKFGKTTLPAQIILDNPRADIEKLFEICKNKRVNTKHDTLRGLLGYVRSTLEMVRELRIEGYKFANFWLAEAPSRSRRGDGIGLAITKLVLSNPSASAKEIGRLTEAEGIDAAEKTITGTHRYVHLIWYLVRERSVV